jgi:ankyrin repeat protein
MAICEDNNEIIGILAEEEKSRLNLPIAAGRKCVTPLMLAIEQEKELTVKVLIKHGAEIENKDSEGNTPLMKAAAHPGRSNIATVLLKIGAKVDERNALGETPLIIAVKSQSLELVQLILNWRPNLDAKTSNGDTALLIACRTGLVEIVKALIDNGADCLTPYEQGRAPLDVASTSSIKKLLNKSRQLQNKPWLRRLFPKLDDLDMKYQAEAPDKSRFDRRYQWSYAGSI